jgi:putative ABC transport system substrate-binding protein
MNDVCAAGSRQRRQLLQGMAWALVAGMPAKLGAQATSKVARIGFLSAEAAAPQLQASFVQGMRELGLVEGQQFSVDWRFAGGDYARLPGLAAELARQKVDIIVAVTTLAVAAAYQATTTIPIVMIGVPDPIGEGFAASLSRPGRNITGLSNIVTEVSSKHVELLHAAVPKLARVAVLINPLNPSDALILEQIQGAAYTRKLKVIPVEASTARQIEAGFAAMLRAGAEALIVAADAYFEVQHELIIRLALANRLPTIFSSDRMTDAGGLMSYGQDLSEHYRRAAGYVDKILKGAAPRALPIEQPTVLEFVINRKTARALGLAIPREFELRADRVVE